MRDIIVLAIVGLGCLYALRRPWIGVLLWSWLSIMNPHRFTYGMAFDAPLAALTAVCTAIGFLVTKDQRSSPFKGPAVTAFLLFVGWLTLSWLNGLDPVDDYPQWNKVVKVDLMVIAGLMVLHSKRHLLAQTWVAAGSLAVLGIKGGLFTFVGGGGSRVWGPPGTFIEDNNEFGLALVMTIPLLRFLQLQLESRWGKHAMSATMVLCAAAALGTQSRGALLALASMTVMLWWRSKSKFFGGLVILAVGVSLIVFMPDSWTERMDTIGTYQQDSSAQGRLASWSAAWNMSFHYLTGVGFNAVHQNLFDLYSHNPEAGARAAHSIYFQVLGNHGFVGLGLFLAIWLITWREAGWLRNHAAQIHPSARWCAELGAMVQVSLAGFAVGGAFLSLAYFDFPYYTMMLVALARVWITKRAWETEFLGPPGRFEVPGMGARMQER